MATTRLWVQNFWQAFPKEDMVIASYSLLKAKAVQKFTKLVKVYVGVGCALQDAVKHLSGSRHAMSLTECSSPSHLQNRYPDGLAITPGPVSNRRERAGPAGFVSGLESRRLLTGSTAWPRLALSDPRWVTLLAPHAS